MASSTPRARVVYNARRSNRHNASSARAAVAVSAARIVACRRLLSFRRTDHQATAFARFLVTAPRFHIASPLSNDSVGTSFALPADVAHHAVRVLRLRVGDPIRLFDGRGGEYEAAIDRIDRQRASARIRRFDDVDREWRDAPTLALALIAGDAMDAALRRAVELGVAGIVPVIASRSQGVLHGPRAARRLQHWRSVAIAACEQCGRNRVPPIAAPVDLRAWLDSPAAAPGPAAIAGPGAAISLAAYAARAAPRIVAIGPEGGFTDGELSLAVARGFVPVHLGPRVLRADTAAAAALAVLAAVAGDAR